MPQNSSQGKELLLDRILIPIIFLAIILLGHYGIFLDYNFLVGEVPYNIYSFHEGNMNSSGWRPDLGLGLSLFYGDPGAFHVWALFRWWNELFSNLLTAYNFSVIALMWAACLVQFIFLRKALPHLGRPVSIIIACLIAFGSLGYTKFFNQSHSGFLPITIPLISLILYDFSIKPSLKHYFYYSLTLTLALVLGSVVVLMHSLMFSFVFFLILACFNDWHKNWALFRSWFGRFFLLNLSSGFSLLILTAWTLYSIFVENQASQYVRDANYISEISLPSISLKYIFLTFIEYALPGLFSPWTSALGIDQTLRIPMVGKSCFSVLLPIVLLITLFHKSSNFWEFSYKCLFIGTIIYLEITSLFPWVLNIFYYFRPPADFSVILHVFGILGLGICLNYIQFNRLDLSKKLSLLIKSVALPLCFLYTTLFIVSLLAIQAPESLNTIFQNMWNLAIPYVSSVSLKNLIPSLILANVNLFHETMGISYLLFYGSALAITGLFITRYGFDFMKWKRGTPFAGFLLTNQIFLSWAIYPMNSELPIWKQHLNKGVKMVEIFSPTDRIMRVNPPTCNEAYRDALGFLKDTGQYDYFNCIKRKFIDGEFGPRRYIPGYYSLFPVFELSFGSSFTQNEIYEFKKALMKFEFPEEKFPMGISRTLQRAPPLYSSKLYDIAGVKYFLSSSPLVETDRIKLAYSSRQFYLYRYLGSWPYFYLADRIETISNFEDLYESEKGVAYLWKNGSEINLQTKKSSHNGKIKLHKLEFDFMEFDYASNKKEFLVIADAWHPQWKAKFNGSPIEIVKTNGVFKGIPLPIGKGKVQLYFDNSPYRPGIWISLVGWVLFIIGWILFSRKLRSPTTQDSLNLAN